MINNILKGKNKNIKYLHYHGVLLENKKCKLFKTIMNIIIYKEDHLLTHQSIII